MSGNIDQEAMLERIIQKNSIRMDRASTVDFEQYRAQPLKSIHCLVATRMLVYNGTNRPVQAKWITYQGGEDDYGCIEPGVARMYNTYVTHPWVFRDAISKCLVPFDAMLARTSEVSIAARTRKTWARHQVSERICFPVPPQPDMLINFVLLKCGVFGLQELCLQSLASKTSHDSIEVFKGYLPQNLYEEFAKFVQGQTPAEFHLQASINFVCHFYLEQLN